jgi:Ca2+-binding EF-hand superfamily protein
MLAIGVSEFTDEEWEQGFQKFDADNSGELDPNELYNLLYHVYHGPPPKFASNGFVNRFDSNRDGKISKEEFMTAVTEIKAEEARVKEMGTEHEATASMYNSYSEYQSRVRSHKLLDVLPKEKFHAPMTTNMAVGWADVDYKQVLDDIVPKKSCAETLYADAMVKAGVYYA